MVDCPPIEVSGQIRPLQVYGLVRVSLAMTRLSKAETKTEKEKAGEWLWAWVAFGGVRRFKADRNLDKEGGDRRLISSN
jgi:hypothetical protein